MTRKEILKKIFDGQKRLVEKFGYTLEQLNANYGYNRRHYQEVNRDLNFAYKEGFNDCIKMLQDMSDEEILETLKNN